MRRLLPLVLCVAALGHGACWVGAEEVASRVAEVPDTDTDTDDPGPLEIGAIAPRTGTNAGGTLVDIQVGTLDPADVEVTFGGVPAEVVDADADGVSVRTPALGLQGAVDVVVASSGRQVRASGGYHYWADGLGQAGLVGTVETYDLDRPYVAPPKSVRAGQLLWVEPTPLRWWELYTDAIDTCARSHVRPGPSISVLRPGAPSILLRGDTQEFLLRPDADGEVYGFGPESGDLPSRLVLDVVQGAGGAGWEPLELAGAVELPEAGFELNEPAIDNGRTSIGERASMPLRWTGGRAGDFVLVELRRRTLDLGSGSAVVDTVTCALRDDGHHVVDSRVWSGWDYGGVIEVLVGRAVEGSAPIPFNRAEARIYGIRWWYGEVVQGF